MKTKSIYMYSSAMFLASIGPQNGVKRGQKTRLLTSKLCLRRFFVTAKIFVVKILLKRK